MKKSPLTISIAPRTLWLAFAIVVLSFMIIKVADIVILVGFSGLFALSLHPAVRWLMHWLRVPKGLAIALLYLAVIVVVALIVVAVVPAVTEQVQSLFHNLPQLQNSLSNTFARAPWAQSLINNLLEKLSQNSGMIVTRLASATLGIIVSLFGFITVLILSAYFLSGGKLMADQILSLLPEKRWSDRGLQIIEDCANKLGYWLRGQLLLCFITFISHYIGLRLLGVPYALVLALLAGLLETIPTFGAWVSGILSTLVALTVSPGRAIAVAILMLLIQQIEANIITPQVMKRALGIPAWMIIIALLVFGKLFGLIGVILAAPMAAVVAILATEFGADGRRLLRRSVVK